MALAQHPVDTVVSLAREVVGPERAEPFGLYLFKSEDPGAELARHVEQQVFFETFGNTPELLAKEYLPYDDASIFLCVLDQRRHVPAAMMRIITPSAQGFKSLDDIPPVWGISVDEMFERTGIQTRPDRIWDIATIAAHPDYRGKAVMGLATLGLYQALAHISQGTRMETLVCILDMPVFRMMQSKLHLIFDRFVGVEPMPYLGSPASIPVWCSLASAKERIGQADRALHDILYVDNGVEAVLSPLDLPQALASITEVTAANHRRRGIGRR